MNITGILELRGPEAKDPKAGSVTSTRITVSECLDYARDIRYYSVSQWHGWTMHRFREQRFTCAGYMADECGKPQARAARDLAREWASQTVYDPFT
jgi:hypothetical protein